MKLQTAVRNRYGFGYKSPKPIAPEDNPYPDARPLYIGGDFKPEEHGEWCLSRCIGEAAANRLPIPASSIPKYAANERRILELME